MTANAQNLRDLLSLARMLRRFAQHHEYDPNRTLFLAAATALEARAHAIATLPGGAALERDAALHAPVNRLV